MNINARARELYMKHQKPVLTAFHELCWQHLESGHEVGGHGHGLDLVPVHDAELVVAEHEAAVCSAAVCGAAAVSAVAAHSVLALVEALAADGVLVVEAPADIAVAANDIKEVGLCKE